MTTSEDILKNWFIGREKSKYIAQHEHDPSREPVYGWTHAEVMEKLRKIEEETHDNSNRSTEE